MPELPEVTVYAECLERHVGGARLNAIRILNPFLLRSVAPSVEEVQGRAVKGVQRLGKRIVIALEGERYLVLHLMIAGRLHWLGPSGRGRATRLARFEFDTGTLTLTEAGSKRRASLNLVAGAPALRALDPGGLEILQTSGEAFAARLLDANHTLKRALTDPHRFSGIGNAYGDEILHRARLSPFARSNRLSEEEIARLFHAARDTLSWWLDRLRAEAAGGWPQTVTALRPEMAVHGKFGEPCPVCAAPVQRIVYAENETNYCARCQTGGKVLADRALSRLLKASWPRNIDELG